jgi:hypothetical protein
MKIVQFAAAALSLFFALSPAYAQTQKPNIILLVSDDTVPLTGDDPRTIIAEAEGPAVYRQLGGPAVFIFDNERHAVVLLH